MIELTQHRLLDLESTIEGRPEHLSAGSGIARRHDWIYVVGDDELDLAVFSATSDAPGELIPLFEGELPVDEAERGKHKPDLETLAILPPFRHNPYGALLALGSGGGDSRSNGFGWSLDEEGALRGFPCVINLAPLYDELRERLSGDLNIEGSTVNGDHLVLFQRGNSAEGHNQIIWLSLEKVIQTLLSDFRIDASEIDDVQTYDLGEASGVQLCFSDGDALPDGRMVFSASAEAEDDDAHEGPTAGTVLGIIEADGTLGRMDPVDDDNAKIEGVDAVVVDGRIELLLTSDPDDVDTPSPLLSATMEA